jgi:hypothetical protein
LNSEKTSNSKKGKNNKGDKKCPYVLSLENTSSNFNTMSFKKESFIIFLFFFTVSKFVLDLKFRTIVQMYFSPAFPYNSQVLYWFYIHSKFTSIKFLIENSVS